MTRTKPDVRAYCVEAAGTVMVGARVTAIDFLRRDARLPRRRVNPAAVRFVVHDLHEPLPLQDASFDAAVSELVLEHLRDLPAFFAEVRPTASAMSSWQR